MSRLFIRAAAGLVAIVLTGAGVSAAHAAPAPLIGTANGIVGVAQTVEVRAPGLAGQTVGLNFAVNGSVQVSASATLNGAGSGSAVWTPTAAGTWTVSGTGSLAGTSSTATVSPVATITTLNAANQAQVNVATPMVITVSSTTGSYAPLGTVYLTTPLGGTLANLNLVPSSANTSTATFDWTPTGVALYPITATYSPAAGVAGQANATASASMDQVDVLTTQPLVTLRLPGTYVVGRPMTVSALITQTAPGGAPLNGSVAFIFNQNGNQTGTGSIPVTGSAASTPWTPTTTGNQVVTAQFSASNTNASAQAQQYINVVAAPGKDPISVGPANQAAWANGSTVSLAANTSIPLSITTGSGAPTSIQESGPCLMNGATLITATGAGTCTISISSAGNSSFAPGSATVTIQVLAPPAKKRR